MRGLGRRVGEGDGAAEGLARLGAAAEPVEQHPAHAVEIEVAVERRGQRLDHGERRRGPAFFHTATARLSVTTGDGARSSSAA